MEREVITLTQEQFDALLALLTKIDSDETRDAIAELKRIWQAQLAQIEK